MRSSLCYWVLLTIACATAATANAQSIGFSQHSFPAGSGPGATVIADVNHDGFPDVIVANTKGTPGISVLLNNGNGTFKPPIFSVILGDIPDQIAVGDLNGDGFLDLVFVAKNLSDIGIMYGNGDGTFSSPRSLDHDGGIPNSVSIADFNKDGKADILYATDSFPSASIPSKVQIAFNTGNDVNGRATFSGVRRTVIQATGLVTRLFSAASADINADGRPDVAFLTCCSNEPAAPVLVNEATNNADGSFTFKQPDIGTALRVVMHDFGDGHASLVLPFGPLACDGCFKNQGFSVIYNLADGTTRKAGGVFSGTQFVTGDVTFGDYDGDGLEDVALTVSGSVPGSSGQDEVVAFQNAGTRRFGAAIPIPVGFGKFTGSLGSGMLRKQIRGADIVAVQAMPQDVDVMINAGNFGCLPNAPGVKICAPAPNATTATTVSFFAGAQSPSGPITALRFYLDNVDVGTFFGTTGAPTLQGGEGQTVKPGKHQLSVVGYTSTSFVKTTIFFTAQ